jgi:hypothetical protein
LPIIAAVAGGVRNDCGPSIDMYNFRKIDFPTIDFEIGTVGLINEHVGKTATLRYYTMSASTLEKLHNLYTFRIDPERVSYAEISGHGVLGAHRDYGALTCLNYYIDPAGGITNFFDRSTVNDDASRNTFTDSELVHSESFTANIGECYVLNVNSIHNVVLDRSRVRKFIAWHWSVPYDQILSTLC